MESACPASGGLLSVRTESNQRCARNQGFVTSFSVDKRGICRTWSEFRIVSPSAPLPLNMQNVGVFAPIEGRRRRRPLRRLKGASGRTTGRCGHRPLQCSAGMRRYLRRGTWAPPYNVLSVEFCGADCPHQPENGRSMHRKFCTLSGSGANAETILHFMPLARNLQTRGMHPNNLKRTGRAKGSLNRRFKRRFLHTFCRCWQKVCRRRLNAPIPLPSHQKQTKNRRGLIAAPIFILSLPAFWSCRSAEESSSSHAHTRSGRAARGTRCSPSDRRDPT